MLSSLLDFLLIFPLAAAALAFVNRKSGLFAWIVYPAAAILVGASLFLLGAPLNGKPTFVPAHVSWVEPAMFLAELGLAAYLLLLAVKRRDLWVSLLVAVQTVLLMLFHWKAGPDIHAEANLFVDPFSVLMGLIVGVIGSLIAVYAVGYMEDFHHHPPSLPAEAAARPVGRMTTAELPEGAKAGHHHEFKDERPLFFGLIFIFLSAMFGVAFSNNLLWLFFFWEITTVCSFLLIRYKRDDISVKNAF